MIVSKTPLALIEVKSYLKDVDEKKPVVEYVKKFATGTVEKAKAIAEALVALNNPKMKADHIVKIIDFMPEDSEELAKIFFDSSLTEEESTTILNVLKN
ncbi:MAG: hypothetical protein WCK90_04025 [archaeon]